MAMIDYGALLKVNGEFINKDKDLFMDCPSGCEYATDGNNNELQIKDNYFVYAGDRHFFLAFYKTEMLVVSDGKILKSIWNVPFKAETFYFDNLPNVTISHLTDEIFKEPMESWGTWEDYVRLHYIGASGKEKLSELEGGSKARKRYVKHLKRVARGKCVFTPYRTSRYLAEWDYNGDHYECVFGYGIDNDSDTWNRIKNGKAYDFTDKEKEIIDNWLLTK